MRGKKHLWAIGLTVGPLFAWLLWTIQRRRWGWASVAFAANLALWFTGAMIVNLSAEYLAAHGGVQ